MNLHGWISAYGINSHTIPVHKQPAFLDPANAYFDKVVAHFCVQSEHCMGALKGRFQCLCGLHLSIDSKREHNMACKWIMIAIILHNLIIYVEGLTNGAQFAQEHGIDDELNDCGPNDEPLGVGQDAEAKQRELVAELMAFREM